MIRKIRDVIRHGLLLQTALDGLKRLGVEITPYYLVEESLERALTSGPEPRSEGIVIRPLLPSDLPALLAMPDASITEEEARARFGDGVLGLGAWLGDDLVAFLWAHLTELDFEPSRRPLGRDEAYLFGARTTRQCRGMNLNPLLRRRMYALLHERGRTRLLSVSYALHRPSIRFKQKLNAHFATLHLSITIGGGWQWNWTLRENPRP